MANKVRNSVVKFSFSGVIVFDPKNLSKFSSIANDMEKIKEVLATIGAVDLVEEVEVTSKMMEADDDGAQSSHDPVAPEPEPEDQKPDEPEEPEEENRGDEPGETDPVDNNEY